MNVMKSKKTFRVSLLILLIIAVSFILISQVNNFARAQTSVITGTIVLHDSASELPSEYTFSVPGDSCQVMLTGTTSDYGVYDETDNPVASCTTCSHLLFNANNMHLYRVEAGIHPQTTTGQSPTTQGDIDDTRSDGLYVHIYVYVYSSDHDTLDVTITAYNRNTGVWDTLYSQTNGADGVMLDATYSGLEYNSVRVRVDDTEDNDDIYYQWDYSFYTAVPALHHASISYICS